MRHAIAVAILAVAVPLGAARAEGPDAPEALPEAAPALPRDRDWSVTAGTGAGGLPEFSDGFVGGLPQALSGYTSERISRFQLNVRADRELSRRLRVGIAYTHTRFSREYFSEPRASAGTLDNSVHVLLVDLTRSWVRTPIVELYSALAAGGATWSAAGVVSGTAYRRRESGFAFQLRLLGITVGGERFRVFAEVGAGFEGLLIGGAALRF